MKRLLTKNNKGFSLIELMIVVAIIGILAAIAVPNYQKFTRKAKQAGGKSLLSGYYTAAKATMAEMGIHNGNFVVIGYKPEGELLYRIDTTDSGAGLPATFANMSTETGCISTISGCSTSYQTWTNHPVSAASTVSTPTITTASNRTFETSASADLDGSQEDQWKIDETKNLEIVQDGTD